jgi:hypothetical protein
MEPQLSKEKSETGYDITPLSPERVAQLAQDLNEEEYRVLLDHGTEPPFCGTLLDNLRLPPLWSPTFHVEIQIQFRHRVAVVLCPVRQGTFESHRRQELRHGPHRDPVRPLRRAPGSCLSRRATTDGPAVLSQFGLA